MERGIAGFERFKVIIYQWLQESRLNAIIIGNNDNTSDCIINWVAV
jgi:hypothetical protein